MSHAVDFSMEKPARPLDLEGARTGSDEHEIVQFAENDAANPYNWSTVSPETLRKTTSKTVL